jgi:hypothetical protein
VAMCQLWCDRFMRENRGTPCDSKHGGKQNKEPPKSYFRGKTSPDTSSNRAIEHRTDNVKSINV